MNLVNAQQARRVVDRIVGFELSPVLWRKMSMSNSLSAGRVQSVAVRLIAEREREINAFKAVSTFRIEAFFTEKDSQGRPVTFKAEASQAKYRTGSRGVFAKLYGCQLYGKGYTGKTYQALAGSTIYHLYPAAGS